MFFETTSRFVKETNEVPATLNSPTKIKGNVAMLAGARTWSQGSGATGRLTLPASCAPGVGSYNLATTMIRKTPHIGGMWGSSSPTRTGGGKDAAGVETPGPGAYHIVESMIKPSHNKLMARQGFSGLQTKQAFGNEASLESQQNQHCNEYENQNRAACDRGEMRKVFFLLKEMTS